MGKCEEKGLRRVSGNPFTADTSSPDVSQGNALILVRTSRYKQGGHALNLVDSGGPGKIQRENCYLHTIILNHKLRKLSTHSCLIDLHSLDAKAWLCMEM